MSSIRGFKCSMHELDSYAEHSFEIKYYGADMPHLPLHLAIDINRTPFSKTRWLSPYHLTHDKVTQAWTSDIHAAARQEPAGGPVFIL